MHVSRISVSLGAQAINYPCAQQAHYPYMNIEIVAAKLAGTYACGSKVKPAPGHAQLRSGWASQPCDCDNSYKWANCGHRHAQLHGLARSSEGSVPVGGSSRVETDCSKEGPSADPAWLSTCKTDGGCVRVVLGPSLINASSSLRLTNTTYSSGAATAGYLWCIDHINGIVYAKLDATPTGGVGFFKLYDSATQSSACAFLVHHWIDGDLVRIYSQEGGLECSLDWVQLAQSDGVTNASLLAKRVVPLARMLT